MLSESELKPNLVFQLYKENTYQQWCPQQLHQQHLCSGDNHLHLWHLHKVKADSIKSIEQLVKKCCAF